MLASFASDFATRTRGRAQSDQVSMILIHILFRQRDQKKDIWILNDEAGIPD